MRVKKFGGMCMTLFICVNGTTFCIWLIGVRNYDEVALHIVHPLFRSANDPSGPTEEWLCYVFDIFFLTLFPFFPFSCLLLLLFFLKNWSQILFASQLKC